ncbi:MAG: C-type lectin domain-containing protein, partial [Myxococcota bacterium]|nr:C-type lectin domain-containing protein [Myxococcota bacterium]
VVARGCTEVVLPRDGSVEVRLTPASEPACPPDARCEHGRCDPGALDGGMDATEAADGPAVDGPRDAPLDVDGSSVGDASRSDVEPMDASLGRDGGGPDAHADGTAEDAYDASTDRCAPVAEMCNGRDDDCDLVVDDDAGCPCVHDVRDGHAYLFCAVPATWSDARTRCLGFGYDLVTIDDAMENDWIVTRATPLTFSGAAGGGWFIGLNDREMEGRFVWASGAAVHYLNWGPGEPNQRDAAGPTSIDVDCVVITTDAYLAPTPGFWWDRGCTLHPYPYVCESP